VTLKQEHYIKQVTNLVWTIITAQNKICCFKAHTFSGVLCLDVLGFCTVFVISLFKCFLTADEAGIYRLYHRGKWKKRQLVIWDNAEKQEILQAAHSDVSGTGSGRTPTSVEGVPHNGINTTLRKISERYWWRRLVEDVRSFCKKCPGCHHGSSTVPVNSYNLAALSAGDVTGVPSGTTLTTKR